MLSNPPLYFMYANRYRTSFEGMGWGEGTEEAGAGEEAVWEDAAGVPALGDVEWEEGEAGVELEDEGDGALEEG